MIINVFTYIILYINVISVRKTQNSQLSAARQSSFRHNLVIEPRRLNVILCGGDIILYYYQASVLLLLLYTRTGVYIVDTCKLPR